ncbi:hypothetical protein CYMTET_32778 [Cymbomonas tetramitiformis]|uniref:Uncharacterized protein n=1 Tax=Cymbomonas tetramitiformis TaxID=36881 RepID=A0AAE0FEQ9_9CHLO|nr:hypothetical protein CYMTET_32778 [Cymbomonas tetramitiformis]
MPRRVVRGVALIQRSACPAEAAACTSSHRTSLISRAVCLPQQQGIFSVAAQVAAVSRGSEPRVVQAAGGGSRVQMREKQQAVLEEAQSAQAELMIKSLDLASKMQEKSMDSPRRTASRSIKTPIKYFQKRVASTPRSKSRGRSKSRDRRQQRPTLDPQQMMEQLVRAKLEIQQQVERRNAAEMQQKAEMNDLVSQLERARLQVEEARARKMQEMSQEQGSPSSAADDLVPNGAPRYQPPASTPPPPSGPRPLTAAQVRVIEAQAAESAAKTPKPVQPSRRSLTEPLRNRWPPPKAPEEERCTEGTQAEEASTAPCEEQEGEEVPPSEVQKVMTRLEDTLVEMHAQAQVKEGLEHERVSEFEELLAKLDKAQADITMKDFQKEQIESQHSEEVMVGCALALLAPSQPAMLTLLRCSKPRLAAPGASTRGQLPSLMGQLESTCSQLQKENQVKGEMEERRLAEFTMLMEQLEEAQLRLQKEAEVKREMEETHAYLMRSTVESLMQDKSRAVSEHTELSRYTEELEERLAYLERELEATSHEPGTDPSEGELTTADLRLAPEMWQDNAAPSSQRKVRVPPPGRRGIRSPRGDQPQRRCGVHCSASRLNPRPPSAGPRLRRAVLWARRDAFLAFDGSNPAAPHSGPTREP